MVSGVFLFLSRKAWAGGSKGNSTRLDIESYGFESRPVHHELKLASGTNRLRSLRWAEFVFWIIFSVDWTAYSGGGGRMLELK